MVVMAPKDEQELRDMLHSSIYDYTTGPVAIRYPRGSGVGAPIGPMKSIPLGKSETLRAGKHVALLAIGKMVSHAMKAAEILSSQGIEAEVVNARFVKPLDTTMLDDVSKRIGTIVTVEDGQIEGGFGSAVAEYIAQHQPSTKLHLHGIADIFVDHGTQEELWADCGFNKGAIVKTVSKMLSIQKQTKVAETKVG
jgi:1-deoxy-D-xylulose-5-phosphate synthase